MLRSSLTASVYWPPVVEIESKKLSACFSKLSMQICNDPMWTCIIQTLSRYFFFIYLKRCPSKTTQYKCFSASNVGSVAKCRGNLNKYRIQPSSSAVYKKLKKHKKVTSEVNEWKKDCFENEKNDFRMIAVLRMGRLKDPNKFHKRWSTGYEWKLFVTV